VKSKSTKGGARTPPSTPPTPPAPSPPSTEQLAEVLAELVPACDAAERAQWTREGIGFDDTFASAYGGPCTEAAIAGLEAQLGRPLPPSYRAFLSRYGDRPDGVDAGGILGPADHADPRVAAILADKRGLFEEFAATNPLADGAIPLIMGDSRKLVLLVPPAAADGELAVVEYDLTEEVERWPELVAYFRARLARSEAALTAPLAPWHADPLAASVGSPREAIELLLTAPTTAATLAAITPWLRDQPSAVIHGLVSEHEASRFVAALAALPAVPRALLDGLVAAARRDSYLDPSMVHALAGLLG
jgi:hypothetical protein